MLENGWLSFGSAAIDAIRKSAVKFEPMEQDEAVAITYLGTVVVDNVVLRSLDKSIELYCDSAICEVSQTKNIVKTVVQGRKGTVKEYVADGDYHISVRGILCSGSLKYPVDDVKTLLSLIELSEALIVESKFLQLFKVYNIVVESYRLGQERGKTNTQAFELTCSSDEPVELQIW